MYPVYGECQIWVFVFCVLMFVFFVCLVSWLLVDLLHLMNKNIIPTFFFMGEIRTQWTLGLYNLRCCVCSVFFFSSTIVQKFKAQPIQCLGQPNNEVLGRLEGSYVSKFPPTYPWKISRMFHQQFMKEFLSLWGFGEVWGIFPGYVRKIVECSLSNLVPVNDSWLLESEKKNKPSLKIV